MGERLRGNEYRTTMICVDSYDNGVPVGRLYHPARKEGIAFQSLSHMLLRYQELLDEMQFPQAFTMIRAFSGTGGESGEGPAPQNMERRGKIATFAVRILFRQNSSWQGSVTWLEKNQEESFRSVLELILLMDSAMGNG